MAKTTKATVEVLTASIQAIFLGRFEGILRESNWQCSDRFPGMFILLCSLIYTVCNGVFYSKNNFHHDLGIKQLV